MTQLVLDLLVGFNRNPGLHGIDHFRVRHDKYLKSVRRREPRPLVGFIVQPSQEIRYRLDRACGGRLSKRTASRTISAAASATATGEDGSIARSGRRAMASLPNNTTTPTHHARELAGETWPLPEVVHDDVIATPVASMRRPTKYRATRGVVQASFRVSFGASTRRFATDGERQAT